MQRFLMNPVVVMFYNATAKTWHPGLFVESPLPSGSEIVRHKSSMHYTSGFGSYQEAVSNITEDFVPKLKKFCTGCENIRVYPDCVFPWNGDGIPATVALGDFCEAELETGRSILKKILAEEL